VTYGYGSEGKHGANYIQTMAASVAGLSGMAVLIQAMTWLGLPEPPTWILILYMMCIGMFGVGVGMLYTPILVDRMRLSFPSGFAVANILRALTDIRLLKDSIAKLGGGTFAGLASGLAAEGTLAGWIAKQGFPGASLSAGRTAVDHEQRLFGVDARRRHDRRRAHRRARDRGRRDRRVADAVAAGERLARCERAVSARSASSWRSA